MDAEAEFPPRTASDVASYRDADVLAGYLGYTPADDDVPPGPNHPPGYRWGWLNRRRDRTHEDDGHDCVRREYAALARALHAKGNKEGKDG